MASGEEALKNFGCKGKSLVVAAANGDVESREEVRNSSVCVCPMSQDEGVIHAAKFLRRCGGGG